MDKISNLLKMLLAMAGYNHSWIGCLECELCLPVAMQNIPPSLAHGIRNFFPSCLRNLAGAVHVQTRGQVLETAKAAGPGRITHADQTSFSMAWLHANGNKNSVAVAKPGQQRQSIPAMSRALLGSEQSSPLWLCVNWNSEALLLVIRGF